MISFERVTINPDLWQELDQFEDRSIFQTLPWLDFVAKTQTAELVVATIKEDGQIIGYFTGLIVKKFGFKILGSPFGGWITDYMGFNLLPEVSRCRVLNNFASFVFDELGCHYFEITDPHLHENDIRGLPHTRQPLQRFIIDLTKSTEDLFSNMTSACRRCIRKATQSGIVIEEASDLGFADDHFNQVLDVFAKQALVPPYKKEQVRELIRYLHPTGNLLLLRARNPEGICIATGIFPAFNNTALFLLGASWRQYQQFRPNESIIWYAMKYWKARGMKTLDLGGGWADYKQKYGSYETYHFRLKNAKYEFLIPMRDRALQAWRIYQSISGSLRAS